MNQDQGFGDWVFWGHCANCARDLVVFPAHVEVTPAMNVLADMFKATLRTGDDLPSFCRFCQHQFNEPVEGEETPERWWRTGL